ncbi:MAG: chlorophyllide a reductase iron protein subunit X, partial [Chlorobiaceae bacterium]|nr:chlorophyllide a reductase iron protein subunit X [Chlorobiaceae bacterium]
TSNDRQSIFTANNICQANNYFKTIGGQSRLLGLIVNRDDGTGMAEKYAEAAGISVLMKVPYNTEARDRDDSFDFAVRLPEIGEKFRKLATEILEDRISPCEAKGLDFNQFVRLFGDVSEEEPVPATADELFGLKKGTVAAASVDQAEPAVENDGMKMERCIERLSEDEKEVYLMADKEHRSPGEIASLLRLNENEVEGLLLSARRQLKKFFFEQ